MNAQLIVIGLELSELSLEIVRIPEENVVQILSAASTDKIDQLLFDMLKRYYEMGYRVPDDFIRCRVGFVRQGLIDITEGREV